MIMAHKKSLSNTSNKSKSCDLICSFCGTAEINELQYGKFYEHQGIVTHYFCLLFSSNMEQNGKDNQGILGFLAEDIQKEIRRGKRLNCTYCKKSGATLGCTLVRCPKKFHLPCGIRNGSLHQFFGQFRSYCLNHRPYQKIDEKIKKLTKLSDKVMCYICYDEVNITDRLQTLWAPCCKKNAWFHRLCVQQLAMSAGYFFKCPLCNSKKEFQKAMLEYGIYIPCQDASWELVPNAYEELLYRHSRCDSKCCLCPKGRTHKSDNSKWDLILCRLCGSQGIHIACGQLKSTNPVWQCEECTNILTNAESNQDDLEQINNAEADDSDSNSDISVGGVSPKNDDLEDLPNIKFKPGPRSFKLYQAKMAKNVASQKIKSENIEKSDASNIDHNEPCTSKDIKPDIKDSVKSNDDIIEILSDDDDGIEILSANVSLSQKYKSVGNASNEFATNSLKMVTLTKNNALASQLPSTSKTRTLPLIIQENDPDMSIKITTVTTIPQELHEKIISVNEDEATIAPISNAEPLIDKKDDINHSALRRKRNFSESALDDTDEKPAKLRRLNSLNEKTLKNNTSDTELVSPMPALTKYNAVKDVQESDTNDTLISNESVISNKETNNMHSKGSDILEQAMFNSDIKSIDETEEFEYTTLQNAKITSYNNESDLSNAKINEMPAKNTLNMNLDENCHGDAGAGPAVQLGSGNAANTKPSWFSNAAKLDQRAILCNPSSYSISPTPSCYSGTSNSSSGSTFSTGPTFSTGSTPSEKSTSSAYSNRSRLSKNIICISDIQFRLLGVNKLELTVQNKYKVDMMLDNINQKEVCDIRNSTISKNERNMAQNLEEESNKLPSRSINSYSENINILPDDTKENTNPVSSQSTENIISLPDRRIPFLHQNMEEIMLSTKLQLNSSNLNEESNHPDVRETLNCKVSIDLNKISNLIECQPSSLRIYEGSNIELSDLKSTDEETDVNKINVR